MSTTQTSVQHAVPKTNSLGRREAARVCGHRRAQERCGPASRNLMSLPYPLFWCSWRSAETGFISKSDERPGPCPCSPRGLQDRRCRGSLRKEAPTRIASVLRHRFFLSNVPGADRGSPFVRDGHGDGARREVLSPDLPLEQEGGGGGSQSSRSGARKGTGETRVKLAFSFANGGKMHETRRNVGFPRFGTPRMR